MRKPRAGCRAPRCPNRRPCARHPEPRGRSDPYYRTYEWRKKSKTIIAARGNVCAIDGEGPRPNDPLVLGHKKTRRFGGSDDDANLEVVHRSENSRKAALVEGRWG